MKNKSKRKVYLVKDTLTALLVFCMMLGLLTACNEQVERPTTYPTSTSTPTNETEVTPTEDLEVTATNTPTETVVVEVTETPSPTETVVEATVTPSPTETVESTPTVTSTPTPVVMVTPTGKPTVTPVPSPTKAVIVTPTKGVTNTPSPTKSPTKTPTKKVTSTPTPTKKVTNTPTPTEYPWWEEYITPTLSTPTPTPYPVPYDKPWSDARPREDIAELLTELINDYRMENGVHPVLDIYDLYDVSKNAKSWIDTGMKYHGYAEQCRKNAIVYDAIHPDTSIGVCAGTHLCYPENERNAEWFAKTMFEAWKASYNHNASMLRDEYKEAVSNGVNKGMKYRNLTAGKMFVYEYYDYETGRINVAAIYFKAPIDGIWEEHFDYIDSLYAEFNYIP